MCDCFSSIITLGTTMNTYRVLEPTLKDILNGIQPLREDWVVRFKVIEELEDVVKSVESLRGIFPGKCKFLSCMPYVLLEINVTNSGRKTISSHEILKMILTHNSETIQIQGIDIFNLKLTNCCMLFF